MDWRNAKFLVASTAAVVIASQVARKIYKHWFSPRKNDFELPNEEREVFNHKTHEINDVILFSDEMLRRPTVNIPPTTDELLSQSREISCYKLMKYIKSARETLDVCMYLITSSEITDQIIRLGQKHVIVRVIVDNDMAFTAPSQVNKLKEFSFIEVQSNRKSMLMHHKFCIIDGPRSIRRKNLLKSQAEKLNIHAKSKENTKQKQKSKQCLGFVMSGSLNWSTQAMVSNHESVIVTSTPQIVTKFEKEFESLWVETEPALRTAT